MIIEDLAAFTVGQVKLSSLKPAALEKLTPDNISRDSIKQALAPSQLKNQSRTGTRLAILKALGWNVRRVWDVNQEEVQQ